MENINPQSLRSGGRNQQEGEVERNDGAIRSDKFRLDESFSNQGRQLPQLKTHLSAWVSGNQGYLLVALSQTFFGSMNALVAVLSLVAAPGDPTVPTWELIWARMLITYLGCIGYMYWAGVPHPFLGPPAVRGLLALRGISGFFGIYGMYFSLRYLSLSDATVLEFLVPALTGILAMVILGEPYSILEGANAFVSLCGVVFIAKPAILFGSRGVGETATEFENSTPVATRAFVAHDPLKDVTAKQRIVAVGVALVGVFGSSGAYLLIRHIGKRANALHSISYFALCCVIVSSIGAAAFHSRPVLPGPRFFAMLIAIGLMGFMAQVLLTMGLQKVGAGRGTTTMYLQMVFAVSFEFALFRTTPDVFSIAGACLIIGGAVLVAFKKSHAKGVDEQASGKEGVAYTAIQLDEEELTTVTPRNEDGCASSRQT